MPADMKATAPNNIFSNGEMAALMRHDWLQAWFEAERTCEGAGR